MNSIMKCGLIAFAILMTGCASNPIKPVDAFADDEHKIATDFVNAISNLRGYTPLSTTVQFRGPMSDFSTSLLNIMTERGYGVQLLPEGAEGSQLITYTSQRFDSSEQSSVAYEVSVGDIKLSREYEIRAGQPYPLTALSVFGTKTLQAQTVDNTIFSSRETLESEAQTHGIPNKAALVKTDIDTESNYVGVPSSGKFNSQPITGNTGNSPRQNIADLGRSNYSRLFNSYTTVRSDTLVFANDSLELGTKNKRIIKDIANEFTSETDLISVIGCSHGATNIENGNALLANGRANRVRQEFIFASIDPNKVLDEGCWAGEKYNQMPARGVVITLRTKVEQN